MDGHITASMPDPGAGDDLVARLRGATLERKIERLHGEVVRLAGEVARLRRENSALRERLKAAGRGDEAEWQDGEPAGQMP